MVFQTNPYSKSIDQVQNLISEGGNPLIPQTEGFCGVGQGKELMSTLPHLSPLKFAGGSIKPKLSSVELAGVL